MRRSFGHRAARFLAMVAVCFQVILPGAIPLAQAQGIDLARYICAPYGQPLDAEAKAAVQRLAELTGEEAPAPEFPDTHCPLCTLAHSVLVVEPVPTAEPVPDNVEICFAPTTFGPVQAAEGPPLGSRGPPSHL